MHEQRHELRAGVEIVVATPGRFIDHLQQVWERLNLHTQIPLGCSPSYLAHMPRTCSWRMA